MSALSFTFMSACSSDRRVFLRHIILQGLVPGANALRAFSRLDYRKFWISSKIPNVKVTIVPIHSSFCLGTRPLHASRFACTSSSPGLAPGLTHWTLRCLIPFFPSQALHLLHWLTLHLHVRRTWIYLLYIRFVERTLMCAQNARSMFMRRWVNILFIGERMRA